MIDGVRRGLLLRVPDGEGSIELAAAWPERAAEVSGIANRALSIANSETSHLEEVAQAGETDPLVRIYHPFDVPETPGRYVAVLELNHRAGPESRAAANLLRWNCEWLRYLISQTPEVGSQELPETLPLVAACFDQESFRNTAMTLVSELAARLACRRVSFGLRRGRCIEVQVLSHSASFKHQANLIQAIGAAMDEAVDQDRVILFHSDQSEPSVVTRCHAELAEQHDRGTVCTLPVTDRGEVIGALTLERDAGEVFAPAELHLVEQLLAVVAPVLLLKHREEQGLWRKAWWRFEARLGQLIGPAHIRMKAATIGLAAAFLLLTLVQGDWRVTADAVVEGSVQRTIAAPIDGYIATAVARAGDEVHHGEVMGTLDDGDLSLQRLKWSTLRQQMVSESREAMAQHNRAEVSIISAKIKQADAELELLDEQLSRTRLLAPFDGIVIEGDLSQSLGTPVSRGEVLFKVAPLDDYRIVLKVDERHIGPIESGQAGKLVLASMPHQVLDLRIDRITSVSSPEQGRNYFRVEGSLVDADLPLRPGMEGVGKVHVGEASLLWIWTRELIDWLRLTAWTWWR